MASIREVMNNNYLPYAEFTIVDRAIPFIDGLKPSMRRILYTMHGMGLEAKRAKCLKIVGNTMAYHPHGNDAIYETLVRMTNEYKALNVGT